MRPIDPYSYHCGVMDSFCEIVGAGVKPMALSHPFASPEERAEYREYAAKMAEQYGVLLAEEDSLPVTPLFPAGACEGAYVFLFIGSPAGSGPGTGQTAGIYTRSSGADDRFQSGSIRGKACYTCVNSIK